MAILTTPRGSEKVKIEGLVVSDQAPSVPVGRGWFLEEILSWLKGSKINKAGDTMTGTLVVQCNEPAGAGQLQVKGVSANTGIEVGRTDGVASLSYIDFHTGATATDYDSRLLASGGGATYGLGDLNIKAGRLLFNSMQIAPFRGALVYRTTSQSIPSATDTAMSWQAEIYNVGNWWTSESPTRLTVPSGVSRVRLTANLEWQASFPDLSMFCILKNGTTFYGYPVSRSTGSSGGGQNISTPVVSVSPGNYFEMIVYHGNASAQNTNITPTWFAIEAVE